MSSLPLFWSRTVAFAGLAGAVPILFGVIFIVFPGLSPFETGVVEKALTGYGALLLSFLGGVRWGIRLQGGAGTDFTYVVGTFGTVAGFFVLILPVQHGLIALLLGFVMHGIWDVRSAKSGGAPLSYARLRIVLTWLVCLLLVPAILIKFASLT